MRTRRAVAIALALLASACGEVHFVSDRAPVEPAAEPQVAPIVKDSFKYAVPTGTPLVVFVLYPRKSMRPVKENFVSRIDEFLGAFWATGSDYRDVRFALARDAGEGYSMLGEVSDEASPTPSMDLSSGSSESTQWFEPADVGFPREQWAAESSDFFKEAMSGISLELSRDEWETKTPFSTFKGVASDFTLSRGTLALDGMVRPWLHFVYFRDGDLDLEKEEEFAAAALDRKEFMASLGEKPFSPHRFSVHSVAYQDASTSCSPLASRVGTLLKDQIASVRGESYELCRFLQGESLMTEIAEKVHQDHRRMVLRCVPKLDTLVTKVNGNDVSRNEVVFDTETNEARFSDGFAPSVNAGDNVEFSYECQG